jgi:KaiC/GvpD/RAD55 family RecA-like ATPase
VASSQDAVRAKEAPEPIPDIEAAHQALLGRDDVLEWLNDERGFSLEIVKKLKLGLGERGFGDYGRRPALMFPYFVGEHCIFVKYRTLPQSIDPEAPLKKDFRGTNGRENPLYNVNCIHKDMEYLILVEGESDCIALLNAGVTNVVGVPGCEGKKVTWDKKLEGIKTKYILFDNDKAGQDGAKEFASRFGIEKYNNVLLPEFDLNAPVLEKEGERTKGNDINEWLMAGNSLNDLEILLKCSRPFDVEDVTGLDDALGELEYEAEHGITNIGEYDTPWPSLNAKFGAAKDGHLVIIAAPQKTGKTSFALNWADHLVEVKNKTTFFECYEMTPKDLARKWASFVTKTDDTPGKSLMNQETYRRAREINSSRSADLLFGYATLKDENHAFDRIRAVVRRYAAKVVIIDNLQLLVDSVMPGREAGTRNTFISRMTKKLKVLAKELNILIILISQTKRLDDNAMATANAMEGSSAPANDCDSCLVLNRIREATFNKKDLENVDDLDTNENFLPKLFVRVDLSRFAPGGMCTLHMEGSMSWIRELADDEKKAKTPTVLMVDGIKFHTSPEAQPTKPEAAEGQQTASPTDAEHDLTVEEEVSVDL